MQSSREHSGDKTVLSEKCKEIEKNNRMGKTRGLQEDWRYQGKTTCKDGHKKGQKQQGLNRSRRDLRRGGKNTQEN